MNVEIRIPKYLQKDINTDLLKAIQGKTVEECIKAMVKEFPNLRNELLDDEGILRVNWMIYINGKLNNNIENQLSIRVEDGDIIELLPLLVGG